MESNCVAMKVHAIDLNEMRVETVISCYVIAQIDKSLNSSSYRQIAHGPRERR